MTSVTPIRIDTTIDSVSRLRLLLYACLTGAIVILAWLASLSLWQYVFILAVLVAVAGYLVISRPVPLHISQPPLDQRIDKQWQLLIRTGRGDELWQAQLLSTHRYQWAIHLEFNIVALV